MKILISSILSLTLLGCGSEEKRYREVGPTGPSGPSGPSSPRIPVDPDPGGISFVRDVKPVIDAHCAVSGCHAGQQFVQTAAGFKGSSSLRRIESDNMPLRHANSGRYTPEKKDLLIEFLSSDAT